MMQLAYFYLIATILEFVGVPHYQNPVLMDFPLSRFYVPNVDMEDMRTDTFQAEIHCVAPRFFAGFPAVCLKRECQNAWVNSISLNIIYVCFQIFFQKEL